MPDGGIAGNDDASVDAAQPLVMAYRRTDAVWSVEGGAEGISARLLTVRLRMLEVEGFGCRTVVAGQTPRVMYAPTGRLGR